MKYWVGVAVSPANRPKEQARSMRGRRKDAQCNADKAIAMSWASVVVCPANHPKEQAGPCEY